MDELEKALNIADMNYSPLTWDERHTTVEAAFTELARLQAVEAAALAFVTADGRSDPTAKYQALKDLLGVK